MLRAGGSAVDACVAAAFASWIAEPALTGPGGGGFLVAYDARCAAARSPSTASWPCRARATSGPVAPLEPYIVDFGTGQQTFLVGPGLVRRAGRDGGARGGAPPARAAALGRAGAPGDRARARRRRADAGARRRDRAARGLPRRLARGRARLRPARRRLCAPATARATRRSARRSSASRPTARASWPTARPPARSSRTRPRPAACLTAADLAAYRAIRRRPLALPVPRAHVRHQSAAVLGRRADRPRAGRAGRRPAAERPARAARRWPALPPRCARRTRSARPRSSARSTAAGRCGGCWRRRQTAKWHTRRVPLGRSRSPWTTQISVLDARRERGLADVLDRLRLGRRRSRHRRPPEQHARRDRPRRRLARARAGHAADEHDGAVDRAAGRAESSSSLGSSGSARIRSAIVQVVVAALDLGLAAAGGGRAAARAPGGRGARLRGRHPGRDARRARGRRASRSCAGPGRNIYFGGAQVVARTREGFAAAGDPRRGGAGIVVAADESGVGSGRADCLRSRCDNRTRLFDHPRVRSTLPTLPARPPACDRRLPGLRGRLTE